MKKTLALIFLMLIMVSATELSSPETSPMHSIQGTWELESFYNYDENGNISDTILTVEGYRQIKIYYNNKVMWTRYVPTDSVEWFGYGSYEITEDRLIETLEYMSASMRRIADTLSTFEFELLLEDDRFTQITLDEDGNRTVSENYKRLD